MTSKLIQIPYKKAMRIRNYFDLKDVSLYRQTQERSVRNKIFQRVLRRYSIFIVKEVGAVRVGGYDFEDLLQESYIVVHEVLVHAYKPEFKNPFWPFLRMCVRRNLFSLISASKNQKNYLLNNSYDLEWLTDFKPPSVISHENMIIDKMTAGIIVQQLNVVLSELEYKSFFERSVNMLSYRQISQKYGFDPKQIDNAMARVSKKIKRIVALIESIPNRREVG